jgi:hypothetical protein
MAVEEKPSSILHFNIFFYQETLASILVVFNLLGASELINRLEWNCWVSGNLIWPPFDMFGCLYHKKTFPEIGRIDYPRQSVVHIREVDYFVSPRLGVWLHSYQRSAYQLTVSSAVRRPFRMSRYALVDVNAMFDAINYQLVCKSNGRQHFMLHVLCHPGLHFHSMSMKCDVERAALSRGYSKAD